MEALDPETELKRAATWLKDVEAFEMYFTGVGGDRIYAKYLRPENAKNAPVCRGQRGSSQELGGAEEAYADIKEYFRNYDPRHEREDEIFYKLGYIDVQNLAKRIKAKVIFYPDYTHELLLGEPDITMEWFLKED